MPESPGKNAGPRPAPINQIALWQIAVQATQFCLKKNCAVTGSQAEPRQYRVGPAPPRIYAEPDTRNPIRRAGIRRLPCSLTATRNIYINVIYIFSMFSYAEHAPIPHPHCHPHCRLDCRPGLDCRPDCRVRCRPPVLSPRQSPHRLQPQARL